MEWSTGYNIFFRLPYLLKCARRVIHKYLKSENKGLVQVQVDDPDDPEFDLPVSSTFVDKKFYQTIDLVIAVEEAIEKISKKCSTMVSDGIQHIVEGISTSEIAQLRHCGLKIVQKSIFRFRSHILSALAAMVLIFMGCFAIYKCTHQKPPTGDLQSVLAVENRDNAENHRNSIEPKQVVRVSNNPPVAYSRSKTKVFRIVEEDAAVNVGNQIQLTAVDSKGKSVSGITWSVKDADVASISEKSGLLKALQKGTTTVYARKKNGEEARASINVADVVNGPTVPTHIDMVAGNGFEAYVSLSNQTISQKLGFNAPLTRYAGEENLSGLVNGPRLKSRFFVPAGLGLSLKPSDGVYVADMLNKVIRSIGHNGTVRTVAGSGNAGMPKASATLAEAVFSEPFDVLPDAAGNLYITDRAGCVVLYADLTYQTVKIIAGKPGESKLQDGVGVEARFIRPTFIELGADGRTLVVTDDGKFVRLVTPSGQVATLGMLDGKKRSNGDSADFETALQPFAFKNLKSARQDVAGNFLIVDDSGPRLIRQKDGIIQGFELVAQLGTFSNANGIVVQNGEIIVSEAIDGISSVLKRVSYGKPRILTLSQSSQTLSGGDELVIFGVNFTKETIVVLGSRVLDARVVDSGTIIVNLPSQDWPGELTLTVKTRGGIASTDFTVKSPSIFDISAQGITTLVGGNQSLNAPSAVGGIFLDASGDYYFTDMFGGRVGKLARTGELTLVGGTGSAVSSGNDELAVAAGLFQPLAVGMSPSGEIVIAELGQIRSIDPTTGRIRRLVGRGYGDDGDGGPATEALISRVPAFLFMPNGDLVFVSANFGKIKRVDAKTGIITTLAGTGRKEFSGDGDICTNASFNFEFNGVAGGGLALDPSRRYLYVSDSGNGRVRMIDLETRIVSTVIGGGGVTVGESLVNALDARLIYNNGLDVDAEGNLIVASTFQSRLYKYSPADKTLQAIAGNGFGTYSADGPAFQTAFSPYQIAVDSTGDITFSDFRNQLIGKYSAAQRTVSAIRKNSGVKTSLNLAMDVVAGKNGLLYIADYLNNRVVSFDIRTGEFRVVAGNGSKDITVSGGPAILAAISGPTALALDGQGKLVVATQHGGQVSVIDLATGKLEVVVGVGKPGNNGVNKPGLECALNGPNGLTVGPDRNLYIIDSGNNRVLKFDATSKIVTQVAGSGVRGTPKDGEVASSSAFDFRIDYLNKPQFSTDGELYLPLSGVNQIYKITKEGVIKHVAGDGGIVFREGTDAKSTGFNIPRGLAFDDNGDLLISASNGSAIYRVDRTTNQVHRIAGTDGSGFSGDGGDSRNAKLSFPNGICLFENFLIFADTNNHAIRVIRLK